MGLRVVSLVPSVTETLAAWGVVPVACTRFCERPDLVHVGGTKNPDVRAIADLAPDLVVVDRHENRREDAEELVRAGIHLVVLDVGSLEELACAMDDLATAVGVGPVSPPVAPLVSAPLAVRAFVPIWRRPWMTIGAHTYGTSLLDAIGVVNVYADSADPYPEVTLEDAAGCGADVVLVPSEPYDFRDAHVRELEVVAPVVRVDGQDLFWWGARTVGAAQRLHRSIGERLGEDGTLLG
ncbi:MAG: hypothetical protein RLZZ01_1359 [Actinomycetota bacterium]|jgi:ABC-type Fe3+-hydroxamate transport system substrate-binding protein